MGISPFFILLDALWYHIFNSILKYLYFKLKSRKSIISGQDLFDLNAFDVKIPVYIMIVAQ